MINSGLTKVNLKVNVEGKLVFTNSKGADTVLPFSRLPQYSSIVIHELVNNASNTTNTKDSSYTCPKNGYFTYFCYASNASGSQVQAYLNGNSIQYATGPIVSICNTIKVKSGDVVRLRAYGVKGDTSNASAGIQGVFFYD